MVDSPSDAVYLPYLGHPFFGMTLQGEYSQRTLNLSNRTPERNIRNKLTYVGRKETLFIRKVEIFYFSITNLCFLE